ncbi:hypothetical protein [Corynebacterium frankenforstense]
MDMKDIEPNTDGTFPMVELPDASWGEILGRALTEAPTLGDDSLVPFSDDAPIDADEDAEGLVLEADDEADADHADVAGHTDAGEGLSFAADSDPFGHSDAPDAFGFGAGEDGLDVGEGADGGDAFGAGNDFPGGTDQNDIGF